MSFEWEKQNSFGHKPKEFGHEPKEFRTVLKPIQCGECMTCGKNFEVAVNPFETGVKPSFCSKRCLMETSLNNENRYWSPPKDKVEIPIRELPTIFDPERISHQQQFEFDQ